MNLVWLRPVGRLIALVWALWWTVFGLMAGVAEGMNAVGIFMHTLVPGLLFLVVSLVAWRWQIAGGLLMILTGSLTLFVFWFARTPSGFLTLALPPIAAGLLLVYSELSAMRRLSESAHPARKS